MLGPLLRQLRRERSMTQQELARRSGVGQTYVSELERGVRTNPSREVVQSLADALSVPIALLAQAAWQGTEAPDRTDLDINAQSSAFLREMARLEPRLLPHYRAALINAARTLALGELTPLILPEGATVNIQRPEEAQNPQVVDAVKTSD